MRVDQSLFAALLVSAVLIPAPCYRILGVFPYPSKSHMVMYSALMQQLAFKGHDVTVISSFPSQHPRANYRDIDLKFKPRDAVGDSMGDMLGMNPVQTNSMLSELGVHFSNLTFLNPEVQALIHGDEQFDVVLIAAFFNEAMYAFAQRFHVPTIGLCPSGGMDWMTEAVGDGKTHSPGPNGSPTHPDDLPFTERFSSTVYGNVNKIYRDWYYLPRHQALMKQYFSDFEPLPSIEELEGRISLIMLNTHQSVGYAKPVTPNMIQVGGLHIAPQEKLPKDLQKYLDEATDGVIYFSMSTYLKSAEFPESKRSLLRNVFPRLKQRIFWKWEDEDYSERPDVNTGTCPQQQYIMGHRNVVLFVSHGGLLGMLESIHYGVPVLGIPVSVDQEVNVRKAVAAGFGLELAYDNITEQSLEWALGEAVYNRRYREAAKRLSAIFRDRPMSALDEAVYWTEYVMRHKGTAHMRSAAPDLTWYQYLPRSAYDVVSAVAMAGLAAILFVEFVLRSIFNTLFGGVHDTRED